MVLGVVGNDGLGDAHSDGHNLVHSSTSGDSDSNGQVLEFVPSEEEDGLVNLGSH